MSKPLYLFFKENILIKFYFEEYWDLISERTQDSTSYADIGFGSSPGTLKLLVFVKWLEHSMLWAKRFRA